MKTPKCISALILAAVLFALADCATAGDIETAKNVDRKDPQIKKLLKTDKNTWAQYIKASPKDFYVENVLPAYLTNTTKPDVVVIGIDVSGEHSSQLTNKEWAKSCIDSHDEDCKFMFSILVFNTKENRWKQAYSQGFDGEADFKIAKAVLPGGHDALIYYVKQGSVGFLDYTCIGYADNTFKKLLERGGEPGIPHGNVFSQDGKLMERMGDLWNQLEWKDGKFVLTELQRTPHGPITKDDVVIEYYVEESKDNESIKILAPTEVTLTVGQKLFLIRTKRGKTIKIMLSGEMLNFEGDHIVAIRPGEGYIDLEGYQISVTVKKKPV
jgi:hypothetical protein